MSSKLSRQYRQGKKGVPGIVKGRVGKKQQLKPGAETKVSHSATEFCEEHEEILRQFDLNYKFGPCIGMARLERWERARRLDLDPPAAVYEILTQLQGNNGGKLVELRANDCIWEHRV
mmetsp:Transcript_32375/g.76867  ORF Transcript_32375/g.76867 Transcript_32375/m.76867 type:complete len:118 (+) Transcript_32375:56-409(+)